MNNPANSAGGFSQYETYNIMEAVTRPLKDKDWFQKLIWAAIPLFGPFMITGYSLIYGKSVVERVDVNLPKWDGRWGDIASKALIAICIYFLYFLVPFIVTGLCSIPAIIAIVGAGKMAFPAAIGLIIIPIIVGGILSIIVLIPLPIALLRYVLTDSFGEAFKFSNIYRIIFNNLGKYVIVLLVLFAVNLAINMASVTVTGILNIVPCLGGLVGIAVAGFAAGIMGVINMSLLGEFYYHFVGKEESTGGAPSVVRET